MALSGRGGDEAPPRRIGPAEWTAGEGGRARRREEVDHARRITAGDRDCQRSDCTAKASRCSPN